MSELVVPIKLHPEQATLHVLISFGDGPPGTDPELSLYDLFGIKPPAPALNEESHAGRTIEA
jgi:hypothetical protein